MRRSLKFLFIPLLFVGCSTTRLIQDETIQKTTIEPITIEIPDIAREIEIPITKEVEPDSPFGIYEREPVQVETKTEDGTKFKATIKPKVTIRKDKKGKPEAVVNYDIQNSSVERPAKVVSEVKTTKSETTSFMYDFLWLMLKIFTPIIFLSVLWFLFKEKIKKLF